MSSQFQHFCCFIDLHVANEKAILISWKRAKAVHVLFNAYQVAVEGFTAKLVIQGEHLCPEASGVEDAAPALMYGSITEVRYLN